MTNPSERSSRQGGPLDRFVPDRADCVSYIIREITRTCRKAGPRSPGSDGERRAAEYMAGLLRGDCGCTEVKTESFREHPASFYGYFYCSMVFDTLCGVLFFILPWASLLCGCMGLMLFLVHFVMYKQILDPFFPAREGTNVTAVRPCGGPVKQRIFLAGHTDAAWEFTMNYHFGGIVFEIPGVMATIGILFFVFLSACAVCGAGAWVQAAGKWGIIFIPFFLMLGLTYNPRRIVDGANDNLTGCLTGIAFLRELEKHGIRPEHTEIGVILTGSEEAGLRGAKAWCKAHREEYRDVPTYIVCFDTIQDPRFLMVNERDLNGTVASDRMLCDTFLQAAKTAGVPCTAGEIPMLGGSTDSAAFSQGGFRSVSITGMSHKLERFYHTRLDTWDSLNPEALDNCIRATTEFVRILCGKEES